MFTNGIKGGESLDIRTRQNGPEAPQELLTRARSGDESARNQLIQDYTPFVLKVASQKAGRFLRPGIDEEISVALLAFNEAIDAYVPERGAFLSFSQTVIQRRLVDYFRRAQARQHEVLLSDLESDDSRRAEASPLDEAAQQVWMAAEDEQDRQREIDEYREILEKLGIRFGDLVRSAPKHRDSRARAISLARAVVQRPEDQVALMERGELPVRALLKQFKVSRRLIERHRTYIVAVAVILTRDLPHLREYLWERDQ